MRKPNSTYKELFEKVYNEIVLKKKSPLDSLKVLFEELLNYIMSKEREKYLKEHPDGVGT